MTRCTLHRSAVQPPITASTGLQPLAGRRPLPRACLQVDGSGDLHPSGHMLVGGASGALAASITMPLDTLKTRLQVGASLPAPV
jgi:hypothetical protein